MNKAKPFAPWTASKKEAEAEEQRRVTLRKKLALKFEKTKHKPDSDGWHKLKQAQWEAEISATEQQEAAEYFAWLKEEGECLNTLETLCWMRRIVRLGLIVPYWFYIKIDKLFESFASGKVTGWDYKKETHQWPKGKTDLRRSVSGVHSEVHAAVKKLLKENPGKYVKRCEPRKNSNKESVFVEVADSKGIIDINGQVLSLTAKDIEKIDNREKKRLADLLVLPSGASCPVGTFVRGFEPEKQPKKKRLTAEEAAAEEAAQKRAQAEEEVIAEAAQKAAEKAAQKAF